LPIERSVPGAEGFLRQPAPSHVVESVAALETDYIVMVTPNSKCRFYWYKTAHWYEVPTTVALCAVALTTRNTFDVPAGTASPALAVCRGTLRSAVAVSVTEVPLGMNDVGAPAPTCDWRSRVSPCTPDPLRRDEQRANKVEVPVGGSTS
jgi:hypothetical protein